jgi:hypothetical protein
MPLAPPDRTPFSALGGGFAQVEKLRKAGMEGSWMSAAQQKDLALNVLRHMNSAESG